VYAFLPMHLREFSFPVQAPVRGPRQRIDSGPMPERPQRSGGPIGRSSGGPQKVSTAQGRAFHPQHTASNEALDDWDQEEKGAEAHLLGPMPDQPEPSEGPRGSFLGGPQKVQTAQGRAFQAALSQHTASNRPLDEWDQDEKGMEAHAWDPCLSAQSVPSGHSEAPLVGRRRYRQP
jgi:hypothetical protein